MLSGTQGKPLSRQAEHQTALHSTQALPADPGRNRGSADMPIHSSAQRGGSQSNYYPGGAAHRQLQSRPWAYGSDGLPQNGPHTTRTGANPRTSAVSRTHATHAQEQTPQPDAGIGVHTPHRHEHTNTAPRGPPAPPGCRRINVHTHARTRLSISVVAWRAALEGCS